MLRFISSVKPFFAEAASTIREAISSSLNGVATLAPSTGRILTRSRRTVSIFSPARISFPRANCPHTVSRPMSRTRLRSAVSSAESPYASSPSFALA